jgi:hypothetical protein
MYSTTLLLEQQPLLLLLLLSVGLLLTVLLCSRSTGANIAVRTINFLVRTSVVTLLLF